MPLNRHVAAPGNGAHDEILLCLVPLPFVLYTVLCVYLCMFYVVFRYNE